jgi:hypothetical protein
MKLLLDECVTRLLKRDLVGHNVSTVAEAGLSGLRNGALLREASGSVDVLITVDRNIQHQQNISSLQIAVIILAARGITYVHLKPLVPEVETVLKTIKPGEIIKIEAKEAKS